MNSAIPCLVCVLLVTFVSTGTYAIPVNSRTLKRSTDNNQQFLDHLVNLKAHIQSPSVRKLLEAVKVNTEDANVAAFVQDLLNSQAQDVTGQSAAFGTEQADAVIALFQSLPEEAQAQLIFSVGIPLIISIVGGIISTIVKLIG